MGKYIADDLPRDVHDATASKIVNQVIKRIQSYTNNIDMIDQFVCTTSSTAQIGHALKEPDGGFTSSSASYWWSCVGRWLWTPVCQSFC
jgi:hypothetical protein